MKKRQISKKIYIHTLNNKEFKKCPKNIRENSIIIDHQLITRL